MFRYFKLFEVLKTIAVRIVFNLIVDRVWRRHSNRSELSRLAAAARRS